jgi:hypothetical protein
MARDVVSYTVKEKCRFRMFDKNEVTNIFRPKGEDVTGGWRILHNEERYNLCRKLSEGIIGSKQEDGDERGRNIPRSITI